MTSGGRTRSKTVSFDDEPLIVVDEANQVLGFRTKAECHEGDGILHRAFSVFLFDAAGRLLLQQRAPEKPLWPLFWSNSCCSHPRRGESEDAAARRRVVEELGVEVDLEYVYTFRYHVPYEDKGSEREVCSVFLARTGAEVVPNRTEIAAWRWVTLAELDLELASTPDRYTPWLRLEWAHLRADHANLLARYAAPA